MSGCPAHDYWIARAKSPNSEFGELGGVEGKRKKLRINPGMPSALFVQLPIKMSPAKPKLLDEVRSFMRRAHSCRRTEDASCDRIRRFILFPLVPSVRRFGTPSPRPWHGAAGGRQPGAVLRPPLAAKHSFIQRWALPRSPILLLPLVPDTAASVFRLGTRGKNLETRGDC